MAKLFRTLLAEAAKHFFDVDVAKCWGNSCLSTECTMVRESQTCGHKSKTYKIFISICSRKLAKTHFKRFLSQRLRRRTRGKTLRKLLRRLCIWPRKLKRNKTTTTLPGQGAFSSRWVFECRGLHDSQKSGDSWQQIYHFSSKASREPSTC